MSFFKIILWRNGETRAIDWANTEEEANIRLEELQSQYGKSSRLWVEKPNEHHFSAKDLLRKR